MAARGSMSMDRAMVRFPLLLASHSWVTSCIRTSSRASDGAKELLEGGLVLSPKKLTSQKWRITSRKDIINTKIRKGFPVEYCKKKNFTSKEEHGSLFNQPDNTWTANIVFFCNKRLFKTCWLFVNLVCLISTVSRPEAHIFQK